MLIYNAITHARATMQKSFIHARGKMLPIEDQSEEFIFISHSTHYECRRHE